MLFVPAVGWKKAAPDPGGYSCTMTAGDSGTGPFGYSNGSVASGFGSIDHEPIPGETLALFGADQTGLVIYILGDVLALVEGLDVWVDGVPLGISAEWEFISGVVTGIRTNTVIPTFIPDEEYFIEIKPNPQA